MIDQKRLEKLLELLQIHCNKNINSMNPNQSSQEAFDSGCYFGIIMAVERIRTAIDDCELEDNLSDDDLNNLFDNEIDEIDEQVITKTSNGRKILVYNQN